MERDKLRRIYIYSVVGNREAERKNPYIMDEKGNKRKLHKKGN